MSSVIDTELNSYIYDDVNINTMSFIKVIWWMIYNMAKLFY